MRPGLILSLLVAAALPAADALPPGHEGVRIIIERHCLSCHGQGKIKGGVNLDALLRARLDERTLKTWRSAASVVKQELMPPEDADPALGPAEREALANWIDSLRYDGPVDPGRVTIRRLNRREYRNTIRDLLGVDLDIERLLPRDDVGNGFDNSADVLALPPALFEKYQQAAVEAVDAAVEVGAVKTRVEAAAFTVSVAGEERKPTVADGVLTLAEGGECTAIIYAPVAGRYRLKLDVGGNQVGRDPVQVTVLIDSQPVKNLKVTAKSPRDQSLGTAELDQGSHKVTVVFLNPERVEANGQSADRALLLAGLEVEGPPARRPGALHQALIGDGPAKDEDPRAAARTVLARFLPRAWRRPVEDAEIDRLLAIYDQALSLGETWSGALRYPLQAALLSPHFLYRVEEDRPQQGITTLSGHEVANRLSYFLWASMPDDELFAAAADGRLGKADGRRAQVLRMLKDPKARALVEGFAGQWLMVGSLEDWTPEAAAGPGFSDQLRASMMAEPLEFFATVMAEDRDVAEFLVADWTVLDPLLARHYGMPFSGSTRQKVSTAGTPRGGVLTMASTLAVTSNPDHTSPSRRGKFVLEQMLDDPPPPPPPTAGGLPKAEGAAKGSTVRARLEAHRNNPECASCHKRIDPLGFAFEGFDVVGRVRDRDNGAAIDTSGTLPGGHAVRGPEDLKRHLMEHRRGEFLACLTTKLMTYAIGRGLDHRDEARVDAIVTALEGDGRRFSTLVLAVVESPQFLQRSQRTP